MRRVRAVLVVVAVAMAIAVGSSSLWITDRGELAHQVAAMRDHYGLHALVEADDLSALATEHSWAMARHGGIFHSSPIVFEATPGPWEQVGQNVGAASRVWLVVRGMMDSPSHREILLGDWTEIGYGHIRSDGRVYVTLWFRR